MPGAVFRLSAVNIVGGRNLNDNHLTKDKRVSVPVPELRRGGINQEDETFTPQQALDAWDRYTEREISARSSIVDGAIGANSPKVEFNLPL